jgi:PAS domain S-box-containing protein
MAESPQHSGPSPHVESEERFRVLFESSRDAIMTLEPPDWLFTSGNPATVRMFRAASEDDFTAHEPWSLSPERQPDGRASGDKAREMIETAVREGSHFFEWTHTRIDGENFPATVLLTRVQFGGRTFLQATVRDITQQKAAEAELRDSELRYRVLFEGAAEGIVVADTETRTFRYANPAICRLLGYAEQELVGMDVGQVHPEKDLPTVFAAFEAQSRGELTLAANIPCLRRDGTILFSDINTARVELGGRPHLVGFFTDVTERKLANDLQLENEARLELLAEEWQETFDAIDAYVVIVDSDRRIARANRAMREAFPGEEVIGADCFGLVHGAERRPAACVTCSTFETGRATHMEMQEPHLGNRWFDFSAFPIPGEDGSVARIVHVIRDITERKTMEAAAAALEDELRRRQKMAAVGTLARGAAHEINNPIMGIMNYAQLIGDKIDPNSPLTEFAKQIIVETERVASVIRGLLAFASEAGKEPVASHVGELVESTVQTFSEAFARDQVTIDLDVRVNLPVITCYRPQIKHVMTNLISNAHDALNERYPSADANKRIRVSAKILPVSESTKAESAEVPDPQSQIRNPQSVIRITVEDHGTGIPAELSERIFEPFFTTKDRSVASGATGRGMGLFIDYANVQAHGGTLSMESEPGEWTRFHVDLPVE